MSGLVSFLMEEEGRGGEEEEEGCREVLEEGEMFGLSSTCARGVYRILSLGERTRETGI